VAPKSDFVSELGTTGGSGFGFIKVYLHFFCLNSMLVTPKMFSNCSGNPKVLGEAIPDIFGKNIGEKLLRTSTQLKIRDIVYPC